MMNDHDFALVSQVVHCHFFSFLSFLYLRPGSLVQSSFNTQRETSRGKKRPHTSLASRELFVPVSRKAYRADHRLFGAERLEGQQTIPLHRTCQPRADLRVGEFNPPPIHRYQCGWTDANARSHARFLVCACHRPNIHMAMVLLIWPCWRRRSGTRRRRHTHKACINPQHRHSHTPNPNHERCHRRRRGGGGSRNRNNASGAHR